MTSNCQSQVEDRKDPSCDGSVNSQEGGQSLSPPVPISNPPSGGLEHTERGHGNEKSDRQKSSGRAWGGRRTGSGRPRLRYMGRRTWASEVEKFAKKQLNSGAWSDATAFERRRLLLRIGEDLSKAGVRPRVGSMTVEEVRAYIVWLRVNSGRNSSTQRKALILLDDFLKKQGDNISAEKLRRQFPPETASDRPRPPFEELVQGFERLGAIQDAWQRALARGQAALYIGTLVRDCKEIKFNITTF